jgi:hypothetical protein
MDSIHILIRWCDVVFSFLRNNEWIALWVEGLALVAIFYWDRKDAQSDHQETLQQLSLARQQISVGQKQVEASHNAERAWLMTELVWQDAVENPGGSFIWEDHFNKNKVLHITSEGDKPSTNVQVRLRCLNSGRSPAWVRQIIGYCEIVDKPHNVSEYVGHEAEHLGWMEPLGPGVNRFKNIDLTCSGHLTDREALAIFILVEYGDIFGNTRTTSCGYIVTTFHCATNLRRHEERPDRNVNT